MSEASVDAGQSQPAAQDGVAKAPVAAPTGPAPGAGGGQAPPHWGQQPVGPSAGWHGDVPDGTTPPPGYYYMMPGAEYIPASWGSPPMAADGGGAAQPGMVPPPPGAFMGQPTWGEAYPGPTFEQQQQYMAMWCPPGYGGPGYLVPDAQQANCMPPPPYEEQQYEQQQYEQQQYEQQLMYMQAYQQQFYPMPPQPPLFAISPAQPIQRQVSRRQQLVQRRQQQEQGRLARKKKAALPAEASFGCEGSFLASAEASVVDDAGSAAATPRSRRSIDGPAAPPHHARRSSDAGPAAGGAELAQLRAPVLSSSSLPHPQPGAGNSQSPSIVYDRAPRAVAWRPYSYADYRGRNYDAKASGRYWELGGLGPAHGAGTGTSDAQWQAQQDKRERQQQFGQAASKQNRERIERIASLPPRRVVKLAIPEPYSYKQAGSRAGGAAALPAMAAEAEQQAGVEEMAPAGDGAPSAMGDEAAPDRDAWSGLPAAAQGMLEEQAVAHLEALTLEAAATK